MNLRHSRLVLQWGKLELYFANLKPSNHENNHYGISIAGILYEYFLPGKFTTIGAEQGTGGTLAQ
jgi:hypothetical protein